MTAPHPTFFSPAPKPVEYDSMMSVGHVLSDGQVDVYDPNAKQQIFSVDDLQRKEETFSNKQNSEVSTVDRNVRVYSLENYVPVDPRSASVPVVAPAPLADPVPVKSDK